ncbi:MAG: hypothetical protein QM760_12370 [Nibricoccus sp.]
MIRSKKAVVVVGVVLVAIGLWTHLQYSRLKTAYVRSIVQNDYSALTQAVQRIDFGSVASGSKYEVRPGVVEAILKVTLPAAQDDRQKMLNNLAGLRLVGSFESRYVSSSTVTFGALEGDEYVYRWRVTY